MAASAILQVQAVSKMFDAGDHKSKHWIQFPLTFFDMSFSAL